MDYDRGKHRLLSRHGSLKSQPEFLIHDSWNDHAYIAVGQMDDGDMYLKTEYMAPDEREEASYFGPMFTARTHPGGGRQYLEIHNALRDLYNACATLLPDRKDIWFAEAPRAPTIYPSVAQETVLKSWDGTAEYVRILASANSTDFQTFKNNSSEHARDCRIAHANPFSAQLKKIAESCRRVAGTVSHSHQMEPA